MYGLAVEKRLKTGNKVCVLGAGTMGSGIAAHLANIGFQVTLLDLTQDSVRHAFDRAKVARPPHFFIKQTADAIRLGSIEENLEWVAEADWVCEAIVEKLDAKRELYAKIEPYLSDDALISTNTSGLEIRLLIEGRSDSFKRRFVGTHFFNPPRYLKLLELIDTPETDPALIPVITEFLEKRCARRVVRAKDTPGFIANRYGMWSMYHAIHVTEKLQLSLETVDTITGPFLGRPRSASFRLNDIVGLDIMEDIAQNQMARCPDDPFIKALKTPRSVAHLVEIGNIGDKKGKGYYDRIGKEFYTLDLQTYAYRPRIEPSIPAVEDVAKRPLGERIRSLLASHSEAGEFLRLYLIPAMRYADYLKKEVSYSVQDFDRVMQWGFGWEKGPFQMIDEIGAEHFLEKNVRYFEGATQLKVDETGYEPIPEEPYFKLLTDFPIVETRGNLVLRDLGDGVTNIEYTTKLGSVSPAVVEDLHSLLDEKPDGRYVLSQPGKNYSVGFDLNFFLEAIEAQDWEKIDQALIRLQTLGEKLEQTKIVAAVHGYALGGGLELAMSCPQAITTSDALIGLPESRVGLIPGGRGTVLSRLWSQDGVHFLAERIMRLTEGSTGSNAVELKSIGAMREHTKICFHPDLLLYEAKQLALTVEPRERADWKTVSRAILGMVDEAQNKKKSEGLMTDYDEHIGDLLKNMMVKAESYEQAVEWERDRFLQLCKRPETKLRIEHMLRTGKPLRN
jgi:3-hydroxyacyl-CoA dehydrogenase